MHQTYAITAIAHRDLIKFLRDSARMVSTFILPLTFIAILGGGFQASFGDVMGFDYITFTFTGVLAQTLFQSSAIGIISLIEDRENDFSQEMFVAPVSRYAIAFGKILGETLVSMTQGVGIVAFAIIITLPITVQQALALIPAALVACLYGGAFGMVIMANLNSQRAANQIFPFVMLPQFFLAGVFMPINNLPWYLEIFSIISPMRYAVDLVRGVFYAGQPDYEEVVLQPPIFNLAIIAVLFTLFLVVGTVLFVRKEKNR